MRVIKGDTRRLDYGSYSYHYLLWPLSVGGGPNLRDSLKVLDIGRWLGLQVSGNVKALQERLYRDQFFYGKFENT